MSGKLAQDLTRAEVAFGFRVGAPRSGVRAAVYAVGDGLLAVKVRAPDGSIQYSICDDDLTPLYTPAASLEELRDRFCK